MEELRELKEKTGRYGPDSPKDPAAYPLSQKTVNEMIVGFRKFDGYSYAPPDQSPKTEKIYKQ